jgi:hypothetical protein
LDDEWEVDAVLQHRMYHRQEQWLTTWKGYRYSGNRNTRHLLLGDDVQADAQRGRPPSSCGGTETHSSECGCVRTETSRAVPGPCLTVEI